MGLSCDAQHIQGFNRQKNRSDKEHDGNDKGNAGSGCLHLLRAAQSLLHNQQKKQQGNCWVVACISCAQRSHCYTTSGKSNREIAGAVACISSTARSARMPSLPRSTGASLWRACASMAAPAAYF